MPTWLVTAALNWLYGKITEWGKLAWDYFSEKKKRDDAAEEKLDRARTVEEIAAQIKELARKGEPIPEELKEELRVARNKLLNHSID